MRKTTSLVTALGLPFLLTSCIVMQVGSIQSPPNGGHANYTFENLSDDFASPSRSWDKAEIERQITGRTFLHNFVGKENEALYFSADNTVYQWLSGSPSVVSSAWNIEFLRPNSHQSARLYICTSLQNPAMSHGNYITRRCIEPAMLFVAAAEHAQGDVFSLASKTTAPGVLPVERTSIANVQKQLLPAAPAPK